MLDDLKAGARYVWAHPVFRPLLLVAFINSAFGQGYMLTLPVFQADVLHVDARGLGLMYSVLGVGAVSGLFIYSRFLKRLPPGRVVLGAVILFSIGLISFAASPWFGLSLVLLFSVGVVAVIQITTGQVILQTLVEDHLRGRVMSLYGLHWVFLPVSGAIMNSVAQLTGAPLSLAGSATSRPRQRQPHRPAKRPPPRRNARKSERPRDPLRPPDGNSALIMTLRPSTHRR